MSQPESKVADVDVSVGGDLLRSRILQGLAMILVPLLGAFAVLLAVREPALQQATAAAFGESMARDRAQAIDALNQTVMARISALGTLDPGVRDAAARAALPEAVAVRVVPLGNLGTVRLSPGDYGLASHIEIDLVRRAFSGESPPPEAVRHSGAWRLVYARGFQDGADRGVILAELPISELASLLAPTDSGQFALAQRADGGATQFIGAPLGEGGYQSAQVGDSQWFVRAQPAAAWLTPLLSSLPWLIGAAAASLIGLLLGGVVLLRSLPALLRAESDRILESAENKSALRLQVPALLPLARLLRQMALLSRRQLITAARRAADTVEAPAPEAKPVEPEVPAAEALAAELQAEDAPEEHDDGIPTHIFRSDEIRGRTEDELTDPLLERICRAIAVVAQRRGVQTLAIAYDGRPSSERLRTLVVKALLASGRDVVDLGEAAAPLLYFATHETDYDSGIMITGGQSEDGINGLRVILQRQLLTHQGIQDVLQALREGVHQQGSGRTIKLDVQADYLDKIALDISVAVPLQVVMDSNFGAASRLAGDVFSALGCDVASYNDPGTGDAPPSVWALDDALRALGERVVAQGADLGLLYDSDGDRLHTVTNTGQAVATDQLMMILSQDLLERNPGADIVYDVQCTRHFAPFVTRCGGRAVISRSGHANVRAKMIQAQALMAGEFGGHLFLQDRWYGFSDGVYAAARLVEMLSLSSGSYQDLVDSLPRYISSPELSLPMEPRARRQLLKDLTTEPEFPGSRITTLDGLRIDYADSWGLVRASSADETLSFRFEGNDAAALARVQGVMRDAIHRQIPELELPF